MQINRYTYTHTLAPALAPGDYARGVGLMRRGDGAAENHQHREAR